MIRIVCALIVVIVFYAAQLLGAFVFGLIVSAAVLRINPGLPEQAIFRYTEGISLILSEILSLFSVLVAWQFFYRRRLLTPLKNVVIGDAQYLVKALFTGVVFGALVVIMSNNSKLQQDHIEVSAGRYVSAAGVVFTHLFAPITEELLFREIVYNAAIGLGGRLIAIPLSFTAFVLAHVGSVPAEGFIAYIPIIGVSFLAVAYRVSTNALGPAVAVHFGYNLFICLSGFIQN